MLRGDLKIQYGSTLYSNYATFANEVGMSNIIYEYGLTMFFCKLNNIIALNVLSVDL